MAVAELAAVVMRPDSGVPAPLAIRAHDVFTGAQLDRARSFGHGQLALFLAGMLVQALVLTALILRARRRASPDPRRRPILRAAAAGALVTTLTALAVLPLQAWGQQRAIDVGLATGSWGTWLWDAARTVALTAAIAAGGTSAAVALARRWPRGWWLPASLVVVGAAVVGQLLWPLVIAPRFNHFTKLPAGPQRSALVQLARRAHVPVSGVYVIDASRRTSEVNAYVTGIGAGRRIVLYDTLLSGVPAREARAVVAHELGHVHANDVPHGLLYVLIVSPLGMLAIALLLRAWGPAPGRGSPIGSAHVPALLAAVALVTLLITVTSNQLSRAVEARADGFALRLTRDPAAFVAQERSIALRNLIDPDPPWLSHTLFGTHPTTLERIGAARAFAAGPAQ